MIVSSHLGVRVILPGGLSAARCVCTCSLRIWRRTPSYTSWVWTCTPSSCCLRSLFCLRPSPPSPESHGHADTYGSAAGSYTNRGGWWWWQTNSICCCEPLCGMYTVWMLRFNHWLGSSGVTNTAYLGRNTGFWDRWSLRSGDEKSADRYRAT